MRTVHRGLDGGELTETHVAGYLVKYATKGSEAAGLVACRITPATLHAHRAMDTHVGRLADAAWRLGRGFSNGDQAKRPYGRLRRWAHLFGYGGHFSTKSRRYSCTLTSLRLARVRAARAIAQGLSPDQLAELDEQHTTTVIGQWRYTGAGWLTTGDAALAAMAADAARKRRPADSPKLTNAWLLFDNSTVDYLRRWATWTIRTTPATTAASTARTQSKTNKCQGFTTPLIAAA